LLIFLTASGGFESLSRQITSAARESFRPFYRVDLALGSSWFRDYLESMQLAAPVQSLDQVIHSLGCAIAFREGVGVKL
jgi:hypothetical protein